MATNGAVTKRLQSELMDITLANPKGLSAFPIDENIMRWRATIEGLKDGYYEDMLLRLTLEFTKDYPIVPPNIKFETPIFHPNVDMSGNICVDILKDRWSAAYSVESLLRSLQQLLDSPNNESPLNAQAAQLWDDKVRFAALATKRYKSRRD